jgi:hypothetical protein
LLQEREEVMAKKSKSKKSKAKKTKSESPETKTETLDEAVSPSWSTDDVYNLLKAVNEVTLKHVENKIDSLTQRIIPLEGQLKAIDTRTKSIQEHDLHTINSNVSAVAQYVYPAITAIKAKTDRLP